MKHEPNIRAERTSRLHLTAPREPVSACNLGEFWIVARTYKTGPGAPGEIMETTKEAYSAWYQERGDSPDVDLIHVSLTAGTACIVPPLDAARTCIAHRKARRREFTPDWLADLAEVDRDAPGYDPSDPSENPGARHPDQR